MARGQRDFTPDIDLKLSDGGLITADAVALVGGVAAVIDLGAAACWARLIIEATVVEVASGNESCNYILEFSNSSTFVSGIRQGPAIMLGDAAAADMASADVDNGAGQYQMAFTNEFPGGTTYRYVRLYQDFTGTIDTGFNVTAWIVKL